MTLRNSLGGDVQRIYDQVDALLDRQDGLLVLFDGGSMVSYTQGFGVSPCQLELLSVELERAVRNVVGGQVDGGAQDVRPGDTGERWNGVADSCSPERRMASCEAAPASR